MNTTLFIKPGNAFDNEMYLSIGALSTGIEGNGMKNTSKEKNSMAQFDKYPVDFLVDYIIKTHHSFAKKNAVVIYNLLQKVAYRHSDQHCELKKFNEVAFFFFQDLLNQMLKEEQDLFPYIRQTIKELKHEGKGGNSTSRYFEEKIKLQEVEHAKSFNYLKVFREITNDYQIPPDASWYYITLFEKIKELEHDLKVHFYLEDNILFRKAIAADNESQQAKPKTGIDEPKVNQL